MALKKSVTWKRAMRGRAKCKKRSQRKGIEGGVWRDRLIIRYASQESRLGLKNRRRLHKFNSILSRCWTDTQQVSKMELSAGPMCEWQDGLSLSLSAFLQSTTPNAKHIKRHKKKNQSRQAHKRQAGKKATRHNKTNREKKKGSGPPVLVTNSAGRQTRPKNKKKKTSLSLL